MCGARLLGASQGVLSSVRGVRVMAYSVGSGFVWGRALWLLVLPPYCRREDVSILFTVRGAVAVCVASSPLPPLPVGWRCFVPKELISACRIWAAA